MFFPERVKSVKQGDKILEIGPGATPHPASTVFLEKQYDTEEELVAQSGHVGVIKTDKEVVYYKGDVFPFEDQEFDYVICSHVIEHVEDLPKFLSEIMRVGKKGYLEFPTIYYDYLHNIEEHLNMILYKEGLIKWCKKSETPIPELTSFTAFFRELQRKGFRFQSEINELWHQGFEWEDTLKHEHVSDWRELTYPVDVLERIIKTPVANQSVAFNTGIKSSARQLLSAIKHKIIKG